MSEENETSWWDQRPDEWKTAPHMAEVKDSQGALKAIQDMANYQGQSIRIPTPEATPEVWDEFKAKLSNKVPGVVKLPEPTDLDGQKALLQQLGTPTEASAYPAIEGLEDAALESLRARSLELGHTRAQFEAEAQTLVEQSKATADAQKQQMQDTLDNIESEWGQAKAQKWQEIAAILKATEAPEGLLEQAQRGEITPDYIKWLDRVAHLAPQPNNEVSSQGQAPAGITPFEASEQLRDVEARLMDRTNPPRGQDKMTLMVRQQELMALANGENPDTPEFREMIRELRSMPV